MKKKIFILGFFLVAIVLLTVVVYSINKDSSKDMTEGKVNKLVTAFWVNTGTWVMVNYEPVEESDENRGLIAELSFDKTMHQGTEKAKVVDTYINMVMDKYNNKIKVSSYRKDKKLLELMYEDGSVIIWDKEEKRSSSKDK